MIIVLLIQLASWHIFSADASASLPKYKFSERTFSSLESAKFHCMRIGMRIAVIDNRESFLDMVDEASVLSGRFLWIGIRGVPFPWNYTWLDGNPATFYDFAPGHPNPESGSGCVIVDVYAFGGTWFSINCRVDPSKAATAVCQDLLYDTVADFESLNDPSQQDRQFKLNHKKSGANRTVWAPIFIIFSLLGSFHF